MFLGSCSGRQSALDPAGVEAEKMAELFWLMAGGAALIWVLVLGTAFYATRVRPRPHGEHVGRMLILGGGVAFPLVVLTSLLIYGLALMPELRAPGDGLKIRVSGEQWWWRVAYYRPGSDAPVHAANELRLPLGQRVELELDSPDVIHSLWIPPLAGKVDMIPGRTTRLVLEPTRTGTFRGVCAEFCGASHALMAFMVEVMEPEAFAAWLESEAAPARPAKDALARQGADLFLELGCGACHTVRGTEARGPVGPDLTHVGSRLSLAAGIMPNEPDAFARWIAEAEEIKPGSRMPSFNMLPARELDALAAWLESLQ
ncbi:cytochrome c oxidase subunit II [Rhodospirillales bacterium YIM 152171]|uniref:Cytochrome aa3 subunit 2 n=1 Tax=Marinimicrococcus flavescens TaxID=3031815 RepID=A0AAP3XS82_9PROT|nr:cytochrome c oxidase subunit II [Marinimicrococcus flavescens]